MSDILSYFGIFPFLIVINTLFWKMDDAISVEFKEKISDWLKSISGDVDFSILVGAFKLNMDRIFGKRYLSKRSFFISSLFSLSILISASVLWNHYIGIDFDMLFEMIFILFFPNILFDYLSLTQTRYFINKLYVQAINRFVAVFASLLMSLLLSFSLLYFILVPVRVLFDVQFFQEATEHIAPMLLDFFIKENPEAGEGFNKLGVAIYSHILAFFIILLPPFLSTLFSSLWIWLILIGGYFLKIVPILRFALDINNKPLRSIGISVSLLILIFALLINSILLVVEICCANWYKLEFTVAY